MRGVRAREQVSVVLVDDSDEDRAITREWIERDGQFTVVGEATNGVDGLAVCQDTRPGLVLLDITMPVRDGFEMMPDLRAALPSVTLVVLSGFSAATMQRRAREAGADGYLEKARPTRVQLAMLRDIVASTRSRRPAGPDAVPRQRLAGQSWTGVGRHPLGAAVAPL